jgi:hypothetical protein
MPSKRFPLRFFYHIFQSVKTIIIWFYQFFLLPLHHIINSMDDENIKDEELEDEGLTEDSHSDYKPADRFDASAVHHLSGMYKNWFLDYASYVILERAVPHIDDGLKPVQRRILHTMKRMDDGRNNKVANIVGETMKFHPHGDASIGDALVQLGQKELLIDTQGNWGNILTGDRAAQSSRSLPLKRFSTLRPPNGNSLTTGAIKSLSPFR